VRSRSKGFDFTAAIRALCTDMVVRLPELAHIDLARVAVGLSRSRRPGPYGVYAMLTPLRFAGGRQEQVRRGRRWRVEPLVDESGQEFLYLMNFYVPRFLDLSLEEKLSTVVHEMWHIGPQFDGDLRRHAGRCYAHGRSQRQYDAAMDQLAQRWLAADPPPQLYEFLASSFEQLRTEYGAVRGQRWRTPRIVPA